MCRPKLQICRARLQTTIDMQAQAVDMQAHAGDMQAQAKAADVQVHAADMQTQVEAAVLCSLRLQICRPRFLQHWFSSLTVSVEADGWQQVDSKISCSIAAGASSPLSVCSHMCL